MNSEQPVAEEETEKMIISADATYGSAVLGNIQLYYYLVPRSFSFLVPSPEVPLRLVPGTVVAVQKHVLDLMQMHGDASQWHERSVASESASALLPPSFHYHHRAHSRPVRQSTNTTYETNTDRKIIMKNKSVSSSSTK